MRFLDFFSGIGGFRLGMEMAGHTCVGHCEIDKFADKSYRAMHDVKESDVYFDVFDWNKDDPRIHKNANCRYRDVRTALDIIYELIKADMLKSEWE